MAKDNSRNLQQQDDNSGSMNRDRGQQHRQGDQRPGTSSTNTGANTSRDRGDSAKKR